MTRIFLARGEGINWSVDADYSHTQRALTKAGFRPGNNLWLSSVGYFVWWSRCRSRRYQLARWLGKRFIGVITNDIAQHADQTVLDEALGIIDFWCYANQSQKQCLLDKGVLPERLFYLPFYVDEADFRRLALGPTELATRLGIAIKKIRGRFLIGSFQRDSTAANLNKPKWEKGPELLLEILDRLPRDKVLLILGGPRRHYLVHQCRSLSIPYLFVGDESKIDAMEDDMVINNLEPAVINQLYNLIDLYLVTSRSEGGPKAVIEAALTRTQILSTQVGMASELLSPYCLCHKTDDFHSKISGLMIDGMPAIVEQNYQRVAQINNFEAFTCRVRTVVEATLKL